MRGMLVPTFVFFIIFAHHWPEIEQYMKSKAGIVFKPALVIFMLLCIIGTVKEFSGRSRAAVSGSQMLRRSLRLPVADFFNAPIYETATDTDVTIIDFETANPGGREHLYDFEKFIDNLELNNMTNWEKELIREPYMDLDK